MLPSNKCSRCFSIIILKVLKLSREEETWERKGNKGELTVAKQMVLSQDNLGLRVPPSQALCKELRNLHN